MLLSSARHDKAFVPQVRHKQVWQDIVSRTSAVSKTSQHNDFLSLFGASISPRKKLLDFVMAPTATHTQTVSLQKSRKEEKAGDLPNFGLRPQSQILEQQVDPPDQKTSNNLDAETSPPIENGEGGPATHPPERKCDPDDMDIDMLADGLMDNLVLRNHAVADAKGIDLPKDYALNFEVTPKGFYEARAEIRSLLKRKRGDGTVSPSQDRREKGGFIPQVSTIMGISYISG